MNIVTTYSTQPCALHNPGYAKLDEKQTFPPRPAGLAKPRRSFTEALVVFCREQKNRHAEI